MIIDFCILLIIVFFGFLGLKRGLIQQIFSTISIILSIKISFYFYHDVSLLIDFDLISNSMQNIVSWIILFIISLYFFSIIRSKLISKIPNFLGVFLVDRIVGFFFGISIGLLIIGIVMYILYFFGLPILELYPDGKLNKLLLIYLENINLYLEYINVKF
jgi:uncharacterized membrane protein required for colicin V production